MSADAGADQRAMLALQARMDRADAEMVKVQGMLKALGGRVLALESAQPSPSKYLHDPCKMPEQERLAMVEKLRAKTQAGLEANKSDRYRAGRTYRKESDVK